MPELSFFKALKQPSSHEFLCPSKGMINRRRSRSTNVLEAFQTWYEGISPVQNNEGSSSRTADFPAYRGSPSPFPFRRGEISLPYESFVPEVAVGYVCVGLIFGQRVCYQKARKMCLLWFGGGVPRGFKACFSGFHDIIKVFLN